MEVGWGGVEWIHLAQDRDRRRAAVNTVMKLRVPQKARNLTDPGAVTSQGGLCSIDLGRKVVPAPRTTTPWTRFGEWKYSSTHSLTSLLDGGKWSASRPGHFTPRERAPGTHWIGGWVSPRAAVDRVSIKVPSPRRESNPDHPIVQPVASRCTRWNILAAG
jgi:hypothetical protein